MKKFIICILIAVFLISVAMIPKTFADKDVKKNIAVLNKIAKDTQDCIDTNFETDYDMMQCVIKGTEKYNIEIQKIRKELKKVLSESQYNNLAKSEEKWDEFIKLHNVTNENIYKPCPPYLPCLAVVQSEYGYTKRHAEDLVGTYNLFLFYKKENIID